MLRAPAPLRHKFSRVGDGSAQSVFAFQQLDPLSVELRTDLIATILPLSHNWACSDVNGRQQSCGPPVSVI
jgi:hypothetical protein